MIANDALFYLEGSKVSGKYSSDKIMNILYGNIYGTKTIRYWDLKENFP